MSARKAEPVLRALELATGNGGRVAERELIVMRQV